MDWRQICFGCIWMVAFLLGPPCLGKHVLPKTVTPFFKAFLRLSKGGRSEYVYQTSTSSTSNTQITLIRIQSFIWPNGIIFHLAIAFPEIRGPISQNLFTRFHQHLEEFSVVADRYNLTEMDTTWDTHTKSSVYPLEHWTQRPPVADQNRWLYPVQTCFLRVTWCNLVLTSWT